MVDRSAYSAAEGWGDGDGGGGECREEHSLQRLSVLTEFISGYRDNNLTPLLSKIEELKR